MGWKIVLPPARSWPEFRLPSEKLRSNSVNRAQTSESGFEASCRSRRHRHVRAL